MVMAVLPLAEDWAGAAGFAASVGLAAGAAVAAAAGGAGVGAEVAAGAACPDEAGAAGALVGLAASGAFGAAVGFACALGEQAVRNTNRARMMTGTRTIVRRMRGLPSSSEQRLAEPRAPCTAHSA